jgi:hypothetical protein
MVVEIAANMEDTLVWELEADGRMISCFAINA